MKKSLIIAGILLATSSQANAISYTTGHSNTIGSSTSSTTIDNVTNRVVTERAVVTDTVTGAPAGTGNCNGLQCNGADNVTTTREVVKRNTDLQITETGLSQTTGNTANCSSFGNINGLSFSEGRGNSHSSTVGSKDITAMGSVDTVTRTTTHTTNGGAEIGSSTKVVNDFTNISELTKSSSASSTSSSTFSSSTGYN